MQLERSRKYIFVQFTQKCKKYRIQSNLFNNWLILYYRLNTDINSFVTEHMKRRNTLISFFGLFKKLFHDSYYT